MAALLTYFPDFLAMMVHAFGVSRYQPLAALSGPCIFFSAQAEIFGGAALLGDVAHQANEM